MAQYFQRANYIEGGVAPRDAPSIVIPTQNPALQAKESLYKTIDQRVAEAAAIFNKQALMKAKVVGEAAGASHATQELTLDVIEAAANANKPITITGDPTGNELQRAAYKGSMAVLASNYDSAMRGEITTALIEATQNPNSNPSNLQETVSNIVDSYVSALTTISPVTASKIGKSGAIYGQATVKSFSMGWMTRDIKRTLNDAKAKAREKLYQLPTLIGQHEVGKLVAVIQGAYENVINDLVLGGASDSYIQSYTRNWEKKVLASKLASLEQWAETFSQGKATKALTQIHKFLNNETGHLVPERMQEVIKSLSVEDFPELRTYFNQLISNQETARGQRERGEDDTNEELLETLIGEWGDALDETDPVKRLELQISINKNIGKIHSNTARKLYANNQKRIKKGETLISNRLEKWTLTHQVQFGGLTRAGILSADLSDTDRSFFMTAWGAQEDKESAKLKELLKEEYKPDDPFASTSTRAVLNAKLRRNANYFAIIKQYNSRTEEIKERNKATAKKALKDPKEWKNIEKVPYREIMNDVKKKVEIAYLGPKILKDTAILKQKILLFKRRSFKYLDEADQNETDPFKMVMSLMNKENDNATVQRYAGTFFRLLTKLQDMESQLKELRGTPNE